VDQTLGALLTHQVGEVLRGLTCRRPWKTALCDALAHLIGYVERTRTRLKDQEPWASGLAGGSGAVEGAGKQVIHRRCKRAGLRWKPPGVLNVLALRMARRKGTFQDCWASRGLTIQTSG
jgi:hypothetical protein